MSDPRGDTQEERYQLLRTLIIGIEDYAILLLDLEGNVTTWNAGVQRLKGYTEDEIVGRHFSVFYPPEDVAAGKPRSLLDRAAREGRSEDEGWRVRKDGSRFWANVVIIALFGPDGELRSFGKVTRDLSERRAREQALRASRDELARSNADLEQFAFAASHDLQQPLRQVQGFSQLLRRRAADSLDESSLQYLDFITAGAERMQMLTSDLLAFARIGRELSRAEIDLGEVVGLALDDLATSIEEGGARIAVGDMPRVMGDPRLLASVFQNLIANALKFSGAGPPVVSLDATRDDAVWQVRVRDNGIGIAPEHAERVFGVFERLHAHDAYAGTGLGLATCRKIVDSHGGRIWVEASPDGQPGTTFVVELPA